MADNLFPEGYENEVIEEAEATLVDTPIGYKNGLSFDEEAGDFIRDGKNSIVDSDGIESWKSWCINCIQTERYKHLAYDDDFGISTEEAMQAGSQEEAESILTREITEAIMADPYGRTEYIEQLEFTWTAADAVEINAIIHGITDVTIDITAYITKGEI